MGIKSLAQVSSASLLALGVLTSLLAGCTSVEATHSPPASSDMGSMHTAPGPSGGNMGDMQNRGGMAMPHMSLGPADADFDLRFIDGMIPHHEGAVTMANDALAKSKRPEIQELAKAILAAQPPEIEQLQTWRKQWYPDAPETPMMWHQPMGHMMAMSTEDISGMRMERDLGPAGEQYDLQFLNAMIPHHEGAVTMAREALEKSQRPEMKELAQAIIDGQQEEIDRMKQWRQQWYGE
jgi:uncharacterized protein (DUF305 family)